MKIIFMGTPEFAVASLDALLKANCQVVAVVTAPDKPAGRGQKLNEPAVKKYAVSKGLPVLQPEKLKDPEFLEELRACRADMQVVVAFRMLPEVVWNMPPKGTINLHASLLPDYRGAAPINRAVMNGEKETGVTTFFLKHEIDTGNILFSEKIPVGEDETAGEVHDKLMQTGAALLVKTVKAVEVNDYKEIPQENIAVKDLHHAPKIFKEDCQINWNHKTVEVYNLIRGLSPFPAAYTFFNGKTLKIFKAKKIQETPTAEPGNWESDGKSYLQYACQDGFISLLEVQLEGKKKMAVDNFLRGIRLSSDQ